MGSNPIAIPTSFERTNFPTVEERLNNLIRYRNEVLAAHELAQSRMIARTQSKFEPFKKRTTSLVRFQEFIHKIQ